MSVKPDDYVRVKKDSWVYVFPEIEHPSVPHRVLKTENAKHCTFAQLSYPPNLYEANVLLRDYWWSSYDLEPT